MKSLNFQSLQEVQWKFFLLFKAHHPLSVNTIMTQNTIQMTGKTIASIFSFETQEHIIFALLSERGRGGSFGGRKGHYDFDT